jgi:deoxyribodipyrimidine photo-lyase
VNVFWHRRDLRVEDNKGLALAARDDRVLPVYVIDADELGLYGPAQRAFHLRGVRRLKERYRELGSDLVVRGGDPAEVLSTFVDHNDADGVFYNRAFHPDRVAVADQVDRDVDCETRSVTDLLLVTPDALDRRYENHSRFYDDWQDRPKDTPYPTPDADDLVSVDDDTVPPSTDSPIDLPEAGYDAARARYDDFLETAIDSYDDDRDDLSLATSVPGRGVSRMSTYINNGMIGIREVWADATEARSATTGRARKNVQKYRYELSWREQMYHLLSNFDTIHENYVDFPNEIAWRGDNEALAAWKAGETGYPLVDAGMRQLNRDGYMHNRTRQNVASFLTKHCLVDWRVGAAVFRDRLLDHDYAVNYGSWQWTASTGTDSVDVRIFDPVTQGQKYDSEAEYITEYVPELRGLAPEDIHRWPTMSDAERAGFDVDYPDPIVGRNEGWNRAERVFEEALGKR